MNLSGLLERFAADKRFKGEGPLSVAPNLYASGRFAGEDRKAALLRLLERYNEIFDDVETDPSLMIKIG